CYDNFESPQISEGRAGGSLPWHCALQFCLCSRRRIVKRFFTAASTSWRRRTVWTWTRTRPRTGRNVRSVESFRFAVPGAGRVATTKFQNASTRLHRFRRGGQSETATARCNFRFRAKTIVDKIKPSHSPNSYIYRTEHRMKNLIIHRIALIAVLALITPVVVSCSSKSKMEGIYSQAGSGMGIVLDLESSDKATFSMS